jgi:hypothetical protein
MSPRSKKEYIETIYLRYRDASHSKKVLILNEFCATLATTANTPCMYSEGLNDSAKPKGQAVLLFVLCGSRLFKFIGRKIDS